MEICCVACYNDVSYLVLWGGLMLFLLLIGSFIKISTWGNFNCSFSMWESSVSFDSIKLLVVFVIFEVEIFIVVIFISSVIVVLLIGVTIAELIILYI